MTSTGLFFDFAKKKTKIRLPGVQEEILNCSLDLNPFQETEITLN